MFQLPGRHPAEATAEANRLERQQLTGRGAVTNRAAQQNWRAYAK